MKLSGCGCAFEELPNARDNIPADFSGRTRKEARASSELGLEGEEGSVCRLEHETNKMKQDGPLFHLSVPSAASRDGGASPTLFPLLRRERLFHGQNSRASRLLFILTMSQNALQR